ncbi:hypothetical protein LHJ74_32010 [Streptomyces sp. N2-109]|uniref:Uncharacterized protein n=1 Tax=Streptomyces gossypii TaxID=2883101 RepID=A0ABT2K312_9ACTN|nr:DUF6716 putative glycosyltransferase [Streptomyces gossypii]MCT2594481.1 hypothetical protein [Streptomyces gossypii]
MPPRTSHSSPPSAVRIAVLADSDTRWKWGALTARRLVPEARIDGLLLRGRATPTPRQLAEVGVEVDAVREVTGAQFVRATGDRTSYDVVVLACVGGAVQAMLHGLAAHARSVQAGPAQEAGEVAAGVSRPVFVTGYVGIVYEKLADGLLLRHGADLVLANSRHDAERFREVYQGVGTTADSVIECALPFLDGSAAAGASTHAPPPRTSPRPVGGPDEAPPGTVGAAAPAEAVADSAEPGPDAASADGPVPGADGAVPSGRADAAPPGRAGAPASEPPAAHAGSGAGGRAFTVVFAVQPSVPDNRTDRAYLLRRAVEHARLHPAREVLIKLRSRPGEHTTHIEEEPYQKLASRLPGGLPPNCRLVYGHMGEVLDRSDLLVTVSSTAALESLHRSVPTAVLTDLGVREALGNHHFLGSGCLVSWDELDAGLLPSADPEWTARQGVCPADSPAGADGRTAYESAFDAARDRVAELVTRAERDGLPLPSPYYTPTTAPGYLPRVLARYGLQRDGTPLPGTAELDEEDSGVRRAVRNAVREAARGAYRHGVQRVAPVIRRMGEL